MDMNSWVIIGRLTRDAEGTTLSSGTYVLNFSIANDTGWGDHKKTHFWKVRYFGQAASNIAQWMTKGKQVCIQGEGQVDTYTTRDGIQKSETVIIAQRVQLLASPQGATTEQARAPNPTNNWGEANGDIPF